MLNNNVFDIKSTGLIENDKATSVIDLLKNLKEKDQFSAYVEDNILYIDLRSFKSVAYSGWFRLGSRGNGWRSAELHSVDRGYRYILHHSILDDIKFVLSFCFIGLSMLYFSDVFSGEMAEAVLSTISFLFFVSLFISLFLSMFYYLHRRRIVMHLTKLVSV